MTATTSAAAGFAPVQRGRLYYEVAGEGLPVALIHAGICDLRMWDDQFSAFAARHRVIRYDVRGYGRSRTEDTEFSNRQDLADLLRHLGCQQAAVIGVSRGAMIAVDFALAIVMQQRLEAAGRGRPPGTFAVIALGGLGGREMSYEPDLDLLYVYEPQAENGADASSVDRCPGPLAWRP